VQYYIDVRSAATSAANAWIVRVLDTNGAGANDGYTETFGGVTDRAVVNTVEADRYDIPVTLSSTPTPVTFTSATVANDTLDGTAAYCAVASVEYVSLLWVATALGAAFDYYEIQRSIDASVTWETIALVQTEATTTFADYESPRGVSAKYRIRVARTDLALSDWSASQPTATANAKGCELILTSNHATPLTVALQRAPEVQYQFADADEVVFTPIYGRDYRVAFQPTEQRGVSFTVPVTVSVVRTPAVRQGVPVFDALRALATEDVPYVCVLDHYGNRFLAALQVPTGTHSEPGKWYVSAITVTEVTGTSAPVDA
jgi:hypothetical protein